MSLSSFLLTYNSDMPSSQHEITLEKLTYGGEAMGRLQDGRAVFVPFGLPGETVRIQLTQEKQNFARGEILEILKPSSDRITAKCLDDRIGGEVLAGGAVLHVEHHPLASPLNERRQDLHGHVPKACGPAMVAQLGHLLGGLFPKVGIVERELGHDRVGAWAVLPRMGHEALGVGIVR